MKLLSIVGARPQFIKLAAIHRILEKRARIKHKVLHTHQHYDSNMSAIFFSELGTPEPDHILYLPDYSLASSIPRMHKGIIKILEEESPDMVLVYGDTNSTLAAAQAAKRKLLPIAHIEAGLRSYDNIPEEFNRVETDRLSDLLFCPTIKAKQNLLAERFSSDKIIFSGDVMLDTILNYLPEALNKFPSTSSLSNYALTTIHRVNTVQSSNSLKNIIRALNHINKEIKIIFPVHPRTRRAFEDTGENIEFELLDPVGYLEMLSLLSRCSMVLTDSGGLQKEAFFCKKMCVTLRETTEWKELVNAGVNIIAGTNYQNIVDSFELAKSSHPSFDHEFYGIGNSAQIITDEIVRYLEM